MAVSKDYVGLKYRCLPESSITLSDEIANRKKIEERNSVLPT